MVYESQKRASAKWDKENMTIVGTKIRRNYAAAFRDACKDAGTTPSAVLRRAIDDFMQEHGAGCAENETGVEL